MKTARCSAPFPARFVVAILTLPFAFLVSCKAKTSTARSNQHFPLTIALVEPLGTVGDPLPPDFKALSSPVEPKNCPGRLFVPDITVVRLDSSTAKPIALALGQDQNRVQRALGQPLTPAKLRAARARALESTTITSVLAEPGESALITANLPKILGTAQDRPIFALGAVPNLPPNAIVVSTVREVIERFEDSFCKVRPQERTVPSFVVVLSSRPSDLLSTDTATISAEAAPGTESAEATTTSATKTSEPVLTPTESADALFRQLAEEVARALTGQVSTRAVHAHLAKAQAEMSWDYRFTYERAKLAVYGVQHHDEAFHHLFRAAEIAIANGDADAMVERLGSDSEEEGAFHRLRSHTEWRTLNRALEAKNEDLVRR